MKEERIKEAGKGKEANAQKGDFTRNREVKDGFVVFLGRQRKNRENYTYFLCDGEGYFTHGQVSYNRTVVRKEVCNLQSGDTRANNMIETPWKEKRL